MKCLALLTCEKVIVDKEGAHSLITVLNTAKVAVQKVESGQPGEQIEVPHDAVMPSAWWIYTQWDPDSQDVGKDFEQVYQIFWPNGDKLAETSLSFKQPNDRMHQITYYIAGLPVGQQGRVRIVTWLHHEGRRASEMAETYIYIDHQPVAASAENQESQV